MLKQCLTAALLMFALASSAMAQDNSTFRVTLLGTGTPNPNPDRFGPSTLVQAGNLNLLFDAGRGNTIRLWQLKVPLGSLDEVFLTHYHSDHVNGLADLWMTGWLPPVYAGRKQPFNITGPTGLQALTDGLVSAFENNAKVRIADEKLPPEANRFNVTEFDEQVGGVVYEKNGVRVTAFSNLHGDLIHPSVGYRIDYQGKSVVISGDTRKSKTVVEHSRGVDLLIHEVAAARPELLEALQRLQPIMNHHTTPQEAGEVFSEARPKMAAFTHFVLLANKDYPPMTPAETETATRETYDGPLAMGQDLMAFDLSGDKVRVIPWNSDR
ncbi:MBL fold metallo-hydrolase [Marinobacter sp. JSM 1782161]|uniref:MBL fold metallo-hydrolase n=1 Tax=Marinobacter sp. JSM 1782161 TaxID=2685906 RepID=UPI0014023123|nr:MBL fold metallo-hydrolase [Marinobacter sp. JSM 1782161]